MPSLTPYRTLPVDRRLSLVAHVLTVSRESKDAYIQRLVARGGGFRRETLRKWPVAQLAREIVRTNLETPHDELGMLQALYVELEPAIQIAFLDLTGVRRDGAAIPDDVTPPFADAATVRTAAAELVKLHGDGARHYLTTIALYNGDAWPGIGEVVAELE